MRSFARLGFIGGAVVALGLAAEAFAEPAEAQVLGVECPDTLKQFTDKQTEGDRVMALVVRFTDGEKNRLLYACLKEGLTAEPCDHEKGECPGYKALPDGYAAFYEGSSPGSACWYPSGGGGLGCDQINP